MSKLEPKCDANFISQNLNYIFHNKKKQIHNFTKMEFCQINLGKLLQSKHVPTVQHMQHSSQKNVCNTYPKRVSIHDLCMYFYFM